MNLSRILEQVEVTRIAGPADPAILGIAYDSRQVEAGYLFAALEGTRQDGHRYLSDALTRGAVAILSGREAPIPPPATWVQVPEDREALARAARNYYARPDERMRVVGITGTNGKTTVAHLLESILKAAGEKVCLIGTLGYRIGREEVRATHTTPESVDLFRLLDRAASEGCRYATMEVSSHALALRRVGGLVFSAAVFTNFTRDHLDFHGTLEAYREAKLRLFRDLPAERPAVLNADDPAAPLFAAAGRGRVLTYGFSETADVRVARFEPGWRGSRLDLEGKGTRIEIQTPLLGRPNASNVAAAAAAALAVGVGPAAIREGVESLSGVPGRLERIDLGQGFSVFVDYAHTDDALRNVLRTVRDLSPRRLLVVFGCGGDRDRSKRPLMGSVAARNSDFAILTSDNPRTEDPLAILAEAERGIREVTGDPARYSVIPDRTEAIRAALEEAREGDAVVIAGKGHETVQILRDRTIPFDDREVAREALRSRAAARTGRGAS